MLVELRLHEAEREPRRPDLGHLDLTEEVGKGPDVILVPVGEDDGPDVGPPLAQVLEVGQHEVDAEVLVPRERQAGVDEDDPLVALDDGHVLADLAEAAERDDARALGHPSSLLSRHRLPFTPMSVSEARPALLGRSGRRPSSVWSAWRGPIEARSG